MDHLTGLAAAVDTRLDVAVEKHLSETLDVIRADRNNRPLAPDRWLAHFLDGVRRKFPASYRVTARSLKDCHRPPNRRNPNSVHFHLLSQRLDRRRRQLTE